jgi:uncharacterized caspase-like protein
VLICAYGSPAQQQDRQLVQTGQADASSSRRIALVIGNGSYTNAPPLKNPPNDARDMAAALSTLGFDVASGINLSQPEMKRLIREFGQKLKAGGAGLFYYAGHGVQLKGRNYLIPVDADIQSEAEAEDQGVDVNLVLNYMDDAQNGLNLVIMDACRNNPFARSFRSAENGLAQVDAPTGTLIAYATAPGRVAADGVGTNGLYTAALLKMMRVPGLSVLEMFMRVRAEVMKQTGNKQVPWESSSLVGNFYFLERKSSQEVTQAPQEIPQTDLSCNDESSTRSIEGLHTTSFTLRNQTRATLTVYWLDYQGKRQKWFELPPERMVKQDTYLTHAWLVTDPGGKCLRIFIAPGDFVIR